ncbi:stage II sporulation protein M [Paenibacillus sp. JX-17]|uniref:Stage II sporulation protein M n=1 Tax=Paenibacillus lacisoli TaxID=3064525 RepID=A0ABT9CGH8_9BACL|nr:stage II sporulation protein M [Paenibacillus sp. JX-17]MDO7908311.1 stage II sporulation protein M [Paenibacillus sp. JX-17]
MLRFSTFIKDLTSLRYVLLFAAAVFAVSLGAGWYGAETFRDMLIQQLQGLTEVREKLETSDNVQLSFFIFIFLNNAIKSVIIIFLGALFGIGPLIFLVINGMVVGFVVRLADLNGAGVTELIVKGLLPHGIIEIPALIIACAFGLQFGRTLWWAIRGKKDFDYERGGRGWKPMLRQAGTASVWVVILLFAAAVIESTLTYQLVGR